MAGQRALEAMVLGGAALFLFGAGLLPMGGLLAGLSPVPLLILAGWRGLPLAAGIGAGMALPTLALGSWAAAAFLLEVTAPALAMGAVARRARTPVPSILAGAGTGLAGLVLLTGSRVGFRPGAALATLVARVDGVLNDLIAALSRVGVAAEQVREVAAWTGTLRDTVVRVFPGLVATAELLTAVLVYGMAGAVLRRLRSPLPPLGEWRLAERWVWGFIGAGALTFLPDPLGQLGWNVLVPVIGLYFLEGVGVAAELIRRFHLPPGCWVFGVLVLLLQPLVALVLAALGLFDVWCGFRRRARTAR